MSSPYEIIRSLPVEKLPQKALGYTKYEPIVRAVHTLSSTEALELKVDSKNVVTHISNILKKRIKSRKFKVSQHQTNNGLFCYIREVK